MLLHLFVRAALCFLSCRQYCLRRNASWHTQTQLHVAAHCVVILPPQWKMPTPQPQELLQAPFGSLRQTKRRPPPWSIRSTVPLDCNWVCSATLAAPCVAETAMARRPQRARENFILTRVCVFYWLALIETYSRVFPYIGKLFLQYATSPSSQTARAWWSGRFVGWCTWLLVAWSIARFAAASAMALAARG
jgi:hypothetical protein